MQQFSTQTYQFVRTHHLGTPLVAYRATVIFSNLLNILIGVVLVGGLVVQGIRSRQ